MKQFLTKLFRNIGTEQFIELRCLPVLSGTVTPHQQFFKVDEIDAMVAVAQSMSARQQYHVCMGVLPRDERSGLAKNVSTLQSLWIDIDAKEMDMAQLRAYVYSFPVTPSMIVNSGNGYHCYWLLDQAYKMTPDEIRGIAARLHKITNADKTFDAARILRLPGTINCKDMSNKKVCKVQKSDEIRYTLSDILTWISTKEAEMIEEENKKEVISYNKRPGNESAGKDIIYEFSNWSELKRFLTPFLITRIIELPLHLRDEHGDKLDRSKNDFYVTTSLLELGFTPAQVKLAFKIFADNGFAAGTKYAEKGDGYLDGYTLPNAEKQVPYSIHDIIDLLRIEEDEPEILDLAGHALRLIRNTRAEHFISKIEPLVMKKTYMDKKSFEEFTRRSLSGEGAYEFESFIAPGKKHTIMHKKLAEAVVSKNPYICIGSELYRYENGVYKLDDNMQTLSAHIWAITENRPVGSAIGTDYRDLSDRSWIDLKQKDIAEITHYVAQNAVQFDLTAPLLEPELICVKNGMVDWRTGTLKEHSPKYMRLSQLNVNYDPTAKSEILHKFMGETFHKEDLPVIWEFMGVSISESITAKRFMIFVGSGDNGKSVWLNVVRKVIGADNISSASLSDLAANRFAKAQLLGKLANIASDISGSALNDISNIKELTGNDQTSADRKFQSQVNFVNKASLMFSCNVLPEANTADEAYFKRLLIVECPNQVPEHLQDKHLEDKLTTELAKSAWLNTALEGLKQYCTRSQVFTQSTKIQELVRSHKTECRPDIAFIERYITPNAGTYLTLDMIMKELKGWAQMTSTGMIPPKSVIKSLMAKNHPAYPLKIRDMGMPCYDGLGIDTKQIRADLSIPDDFKINIKQN
ncbi:MAG: DNA primase family protein [Paraclostridium sp.]